MALFTVIVLVFLRTTVKSATDIDVRDLLLELFTYRSYDKLVKPIVNQSEPVPVYLDYFLYGINDVNEVEQKLTTTGYLDIYWYDHFLSWDPEDYGDLEHLYVPQSKVWKPDVSLQNGFKNLQELGSDFILIHVRYDGLVFWQPYQVFESKCNFDSTYFPFDQQTCNLDFIVWALDAHEVDLLVGSEGINMEEALESHGQWDISSADSYNIDNVNEDKNRFFIKLQRKPLFVMINVIVPIILLSILNIFTFKIPADSGERMGYTITVWLAFAVFLTIVSGSLPQSSDTTPVISIYIMIQLGIGTTTVILSSIQLSVVSRSDDKPVLSCLRNIVGIVRKHKIGPEDGECDGAGNPDSIITWKDGMSTLDTILFWLFFIILVITTLTVLILAIFSNN